MYEQQQQILGVQQKILDHLTQPKANLDQLKDGAAQSTSQEGQASAGQSISHRHFPRCNKIKTQKFDSKYVGLPASTQGAA